MIRRLAVLALVLSCATVSAQEGKTRRTEGVVFLRAAAPTSADDVRLGDWWVDYDASPVVSYVLTDDSPVTWTAVSTGAGIGHKVQDEGITLTGRDTLDFAGAGVTCADSGGTKTLCTIPGGSGYDTIEDHGTLLTQRAMISFDGDGVNCTDDAINSKTYCSIPLGVHGLLNTAHGDTTYEVPDLGNLIYGGAGALWRALVGNTTATKQYLSQTGTGAVSAAPVWSQPAFSELSGSVTDAQVPNTITIDLATAATALAANGANCSAGSYPLGVDASGAVEGCTVAGGGTTHNLLSATHTDTFSNSVAEGALIRGSAGGVAWDLLSPATDGDLLTLVGGLPEWVTPGFLTSPVAIADGGTGQTTATAAFDALAPTTTSGDLSYYNGTDNVRLAKGTAYQLLRTSPTSGFPEWGHSVAPLAGNVGVAASASYTTVFSITPVASKTNVIHFNILHTASATTVGVQFRVSSADAGNVGNCFFTAHGIAGTAASATAEEYDVIAIGAAPADNASAAAGFTALNLVEIWCQFTSDGTPGAVLLEAQLETGTTSINVLAGSYYTYIYN